MKDGRLKNFPRVTGTNLNKTEVNIPENLEGELNLLIVAFQQWQQADVNTWVPFLNSMRENHSIFQYYEIPTIRRMNWLYQRIIDGGMRAGIPSVDIREHTITLYIEKYPFREALGIETENEIHLFLVDRNGRIYGEWIGPYNSQSGEELAEKITSIKTASMD
jgi:hypothetical protein